MLRHAAMVLLSIAIAGDPEVELPGSLGWPRLAGQSGGRAEVRLWRDRGLAVPHHILRLRRDGTRFSGEIARWWTNDPDLLGMVHPESGRTFDQIESGGCPKLIRMEEVTICVTPLSRRAAAKAWSALSAAGLWELEEREPADGPIVLSADAEGLVVERSDARGDRRLRFTTSSPRDDAYDARAAKAAKIVDELDSLTKRR
jgi:hypothetical protein